MVLCNLFCRTVEVSKLKAVLIDLIYYSNTSDDNVTDIIIHFIGLGKVSISPVKVIHHIIILGDH